MKFKTVATGGTFDHLHSGHMALLAKSFQVGDTVVIGVTSDEFVTREGKSPDLPYGERVRQLRTALKSSFPGRRFVIARLDDYFGPGIASAEVEAIVVSHETAPRVPLANKLRAEKGFPPLKVVTVETVLAQDGGPISSTRIRSGEIDLEGRPVGKPPTRKSGRRI